MPSSILTRHGTECKANALSVRDSPPMILVSLILIRAHFKSLIKAQLGGVVIKSCAHVHKHLPPSTHVNVMVS